MIFLNEEVIPDGHEEIIPEGEGMGVGNIQSGGSKRREDFYVDELLFTQLASFLK